VYGFAADVMFVASFDVVYESVMMILGILMLVVEF